MAYQSPANGLLSLATAIDPCEPISPRHPRATGREKRVWTWRYCNNRCIYEQLCIAQHVAHPDLTDRYDTAERWWENAQLWLTRDMRPDKPGMSIYLLALRNMKRALSRTQPEYWR